MFTYKFIISIFTLLKYTQILNSAYDNERLIEKLSYSLGCQMRRASFARIYGVLNPYIRDGKYDPGQVIEINEMGAEDNTQWMTKWTFERLNLIRDFITTENLLDVLTYDMQDLGDSNYLFIIKPIFISEVLSSLWKMAIEVLGIVSIGIGVWMIFF